ncbi:MAG: flavodoxin [Methanomassiliicoccales archaeon PtaU1.Bin124]|nr:MAG: flavodoxin [Methanomassiliicoccales archaeon PtaU1.Bin124]
MKAIVFYESKHGNTEAIAEAIVRGMKDGGIEDVLLMKLKTADEEDFKDRQLWVVGSPTHWGSTGFRLKTLLVNALKYEGEGKKAAVFDTRYQDMNRGSADKLVRIMAKWNVPVITEPEHFTVQTIRGPLVEGEEKRAEEYGRKIAKAALSA